jgi:hypothetical protein
MSMTQWLSANQPAFAISSGHVSARWELLADPADELAAMRTTLWQLGDFMAAVTGRSLVEHFYIEAVDGLTERLRTAAIELGLYGHA